MPLNRVKKTNFPGVSALDSRVCGATQQPYPGHTGEQLSTGAALKSTIFYACQYLLIAHIAHIAT